MNERIENSVSKNLSLLTVWAYEHECSSYVNMHIVCYTDGRLCSIYHFSNSVAMVSENCNITSLSILMYLN